MGRRFSVAGGASAPLLVALAGCAASVAEAAAALEGRREQRQALRAETVEAARQKWWPFTASEETTPKPAAPLPQKPVRRIEEVKKDVLASLAFRHKTAALCGEAKADEGQRCERLAANRLFCALMARHQEEYEGMAGASAEKAKCDSIDIMENSVEATEDAKLEEDSQRD